MFAQTPLYEDVIAEVEGQRQKVLTFGLMVDPVVPNASDILYRIPESSSLRMDLISQQFYGTPELWWAIALVNNILDPLSGLEVGKTIRVPTRDRLAAEGILSV
jgi:nucleoid-associated protein YgaU